MSPGQAETLEGITLWALIIAMFQFWPMFFLHWYQFAYIAVVALLIVLLIFLRAYRQTLSKQHGAKEMAKNSIGQPMFSLAWLALALYVAVSAYFNRPITASFVLVTATLVVIFAVVLAIVRFALSAVSRRSEG